MKRPTLIALFVCLTSLLLASQSNPGVAHPPSIARSGRAASQEQGPLFASAETLPVFGSPTAAVGDLNGDGKPDLAVAIFGGNTGTVDVFLGNGDATFTMFGEYGSGAVDPNSVQLADLNGDGKLDMVVLNCSTDEPGNCAADTDGVVSIFLGNGDGTFQAPILSDAGAKGPVRVLVADLNLDGKPDLLVQLQQGGFGVMLGNGDGTFQPPSFTAGYGSLSLADLNGDGIPDLLLGAFQGRSVSVLLGKGDGTFVFSGSFPLSESVIDAVVADLDGDGRLDMITLTYDAAKTANYVSTLKGNGDGTFQPQVRYPKLSAFEDNSSHLAVADLNADGALDVVVAGFKLHVGNGELTVLLNKGNGKLGKAVIYDAGGFDTNSTTIADLNGDGRPDLVTTGFGSSNVGILLNIGPYTTSAVLASSLNPSTQGQAVTFTATVGSPGGAPPDGETVIFKKGTKVLGKATLSAGTASLTTSKLKVGTTAISAVYGGDSSFGQSLSNIIEQIVNQK